MRTVSLWRTYHPTGTNGLMMLNGEVLCHTIELPWRDNQRSVSCIPEGRYLPALRWNRRWGWHFQIPHVPSRDAILIHPANNALRELRGCIAPVMVHTGPGQGNQSRKAMGVLQERLGNILRSGMAIELIIHS